MSDNNQTKDIIFIDEKKEIDGENDGEKADTNIIDLKRDLDAIIKQTEAAKQIIKYGDERLTEADLVDILSDLTLPRKIAEKIVDFGVIDPLIPYPVSNVEKAVRDIYRLSEKLHKTPFEIVSKLDVENEIKDILYQAVGAESIYRSSMEIAKQDKKPNIGKYAVLGGAIGAISVGLGLVSGAIIAIGGGYALCKLGRKFEQWYDQEADKYNKSKVHKTSGRLRNEKIDTLQNKLNDYALSKHDKQKNK